MRAIAIAFVLATLGTQAAAEERYVDLNRPGALDAIARDNPAHYRQILEITRVASEVSCETALKMLPVPAASRLECVAIALMTSDPPKRRVNFELDSIRYRMVVTLKTQPGELIPLK